MQRAAFGLNCRMFFAGKGFPAGEWNVYVPASIAFWGQTATCQGNAPETPHGKESPVCMKYQQETTPQFKLLCGASHTRLCYRISCSNSSNSVVLKNWPSVISKPSHIFLMVATSGLFFCLREYCKWFLYQDRTTWRESTTMLTHGKNLCGATLCRLPKHIKLSLHK